MPLLLQGKHIEPVYSAKYLGIYLDCKLSRSEHIKGLCIKVSKLSGVFNHITSFINTDMVILIFLKFMNHLLLMS